MKKSFVEELTTSTSTSVPFDVLILTLGTSIILFGGYYSLIYTYNTLLFSSQMLNNATLINKISISSQGILNYFPKESTAVQEAFKEILLKLNNLPVSPDLLNSKGVLELELLLNRLKTWKNIIELDYFLIANEQKAKNIPPMNLYKKFITHGLDVVDDINQTLQKISSTVNVLEESKSLEQIQISEENKVTEQIQPSSDSQSSNADLIPFNESNNFLDKFSDFLIIGQFISISTFLIFSFFLIKKQLVIFFPYFLCIFTIKIQEIVMFLRMLIKKIACKFKKFF
jgi:hypothetical protein